MKSLLPEQEHVLLNIISDSSHESTILPVVHLPDVYNSHDVDEAIKPFTFGTVAYLIAHEKGKFTTKVFHSKIHPLPAVGVVVCGIWLFPL